jgi:hypothetical protein
MSWVAAILVTVLASAEPSGYFRFVPAVSFSLWVMLRHPCACQPLQLGEGCSSTAFGYMATAPPSVWINPGKTWFRDHRRCRPVGGAVSLP